MGGPEDEKVAPTGGPVGDSGESVTDALRSSSGKLHPLGGRRLSDDEEDILEATAGDSGRLDPTLGLEHYVAARARAQEPVGHHAQGEEYGTFSQSQSPSPFIGSPGVSRWSSDPSPEPYGKVVDELQREMSTSGLSRTQQERIFERASQEISQPASKKKLSPTIDYLSALAHLAVFGVLGVLIRYGFEVLFGPQVAGETDDHNAIFRDLPPNMVGSFFMGWVGVVLKKEISLFSELLAVGLSTGLMGSITTFASWNQRMVTMATGGHWVQAIFTLFIGFEMSWMSLIIGIDSAKGFLTSIQFLQQRRVKRGSERLQWPAADNLARRWTSFWFFAFLAVSMWMAALLLTLVHISHAVRRRLWLACAVAPPGVWTRWHLARLNGRGFGSKPWLRWLPVGTLLANVIASLLEAGLATVQVAADDDDATLLAGALQLGLLGCMSTISTFVVEVHTMHQSEKPWKAYAYVFISITCSFLLGILAYSTPVWALQLA